jgi:5'-deoxynucleotidase YfbR-like HD superfamily hydrolase
MQRKFIFNGGASKRYHTVDTHTKQDIAAHSFGVAWFCELFTGGKASKNLIMAALSHDLAEHIVGDIPSPAKRTNGIGKLFDEIEHRYMVEAGVAHYGDNLTKDEVLIMKFADLMEGASFCLRERRSGNQHVDEIFERFSTYTLSLAEANKDLPELEVILDTLNELVQEWKETVNGKCKSTPSSRNTL